MDILDEHKAKLEEQKSEVERQKIKRREVKSRLGMVEVRMVKLEQRVEELVREAERTRCRCGGEKGEESKEEPTDVEEEESNVVLVEDEHFNPLRMFGGAACSLWCSKRIGPYPAREQTLD